MTGPHGETVGVFGLGNHGYVRVDLATVVGEIGIWHDNAVGHFDGFGDPIGRPKAVNDPIGG